MLLLAIGITAPTPAFPQYLTGLGASVAIIGLVISLRGVGNMIADIPGGVILGRVPIRFVAITAFGVAAVASVGIALARSVAVIGLLTLVLGSMTAVVATAMMTYVRSAMPAQSRGRALSLVGGSMRIGSLIGPAVGGILADAFGVPATFVLRSICMAAALLSVALSPDRSVRVARSQRPSTRTQAREVRRGLSGRWMALATVGFSIFVLMLLRASRSIILPLVGDRLGLTATTIGAVISAGAALDLVMFVPAGIIMDRAGRKLAASLCIGIFAVALLLLANVSTVVAFVLVSLLIGLGNGLGSGINMTLGTDLAPASAVSAFLGAWRLFGDVGQAVGPVIIGAVATAASLPVAILSTGVLGFVGLAVMVFLAPETLHLARKSESDAATE